MRWPDGRFTCPRCGSRNELVHRDASTVALPKSHEAVHYKDWDHHGRFAHRSGQVDDGHVANRELQERDQFLYEVSPGHRDHSEVCMVHASTAPHCAAQSFVWLYHEAWWAGCGTSKRMKPSSAEHHEEHAQGPQASPGTSRRGAALSDKTIVQGILDRESARSSRHRLCRT